MDRFVNRQNIDRFRRLASQTTSATERQQIMRLLADEEVKFRLDQAVGDLDKTRQLQAGTNPAEATGTR